MEVLDVRKDNIWLYEQNKPSLIAQDLLEYGVPYDVSMKILLARGVFKWLGVRRRLIKLKDVWRNRLTDTYTKIQNAKKDSKFYDVAYYRGYIKALEECRKEVRQLCHSERWQCPDFDEKGNRFLRELELH